MAAPPSGWYDDPNDDTSLRYWDGVVWTSHVAAKSLPPDPAPVAGPDSTPTWGPRLGGPPTNPFATGRSPQQGRWAPGADRRGPGRRGATHTADGQELAGWWRRVLAFVLDSAGCNLLTLLIAWPVVAGPLEALQRWWSQGMADAVAGRVMTAPPAELLAQLSSVVLLMTAVYAGYEIVALTRWGTTLGRRAVGLRVRLAERAGPLPVGVVVRRTLVKVGGDVASAAPVIGDVGAVFTILDRLWPLWDPQRQALHDKVGRTQVVRLRRA
jgi:uncharacterized RDD family membrane protein YckC